MITPDAARAAFAALPRLARDAAYVVAYSGGIDSTVLLHLAHHGLGLTPLRVVHVNHGLQAQSAEWALHCRRQCELLGLDCETVNVTVDHDSGLGLEAAARNARYAALSAVMQAGDMLLTAHHADDQAETFLLQAMRGGGVRGLAAMPMIRPLAQGSHARPLLNFSRSDIRAYAEKYELSWIDDPSNADETFSRNYLRHKVMPLLTDGWQHVSQRLSLTAERCAETISLLDEIAQNDLKACQHADSAQTLNVQVYVSMSMPRRHNLITHWARAQSLPIPQKRFLREIDAQLESAREGAQIRIAWSGVELRVYRDQMFLIPVQPEIDSGWRSEWDASGPLDLPAGCGELVIDGSQRSAPLPQTPLNVRLAQPGDSICINAAAGHQRLSKLCQQAGIAPWVRDRMPVIYADDELLTVADRWYSEKWCSGTHLRLIWQHAPAGYCG